MSDGVISDISETLRKLLQDKLADLVAPDHVSVESPAEIVLDTNPWLIIFLYQVTENPHFKYQEPERIASDQISRPPFVVDLHYLFVPYGQNRDNEYQILGRVIQTFSDQPTLRGSWLQGGLAGSDKEFRIVHQSLSLEELVRLWTTFYNRPFKASVSCQVTPVGIDSALAPVTVRPVVERDLRFHRGHDDVA